MQTPSNASLSPWVAWEQTQLIDKYARLVDGRLEPNAHQFYTGNASLNRQRFCATGGFDESFHRNEDLELAYRLEDDGVRFVYWPAATGFHHAQRSYAQWLQIPYEYGRNSVRCAREKGHERLLDRWIQAYPQFHPLTRATIYACLDRPRAAHATINTLTTLTLRAYQTGHHNLAYDFFSVIYNLQRHQGVADGLGGRRRFLEAVKSTLS